MKGNTVKKLFKCLFKLGLVAGAGVIAIQFQPVRDALKKIGLPL